LDKRGNELAIAQKRNDAGLKPNIGMDQGDDIGWFNVRAYNHGIVSGASRQLQLEAQLKRKE